MVAVPVARAASPLPSVLFVSSLPARPTIVPRPRSPTSTARPTPQAARAARTARTRADSVAAAVSTRSTNTSSASRPSARAFTTRPHCWRSRPRGRPVGELEWNNGQTQAVVLVCIAQFDHIQPISSLFTLIPRLPWPLIISIDFSRTRFNSFPHASILYTILSPSFSLHPFYLLLAPSFILLSILLSPFLVSSFSLSFPHSVDYFHRPVVEFKVINKTSKKR